LSRWGGLSCARTPLDICGIFFPPPSPPPEMISATVAVKLLPLVLVFFRACPLSSFPSLVTFPSKVPPFFFFPTGTPRNHGGFFSSSLGVQGSCVYKADPFVHSNLFLFCLVKLTQSFSLGCSSSLDPFTPWFFLFCRTSVLLR